MVDNSEDTLKKMNSNVVVKKLQAPFEKRLPTTNIKFDDVKNLVKLGHGNVILSLLSGLPLFATGIHTLGKLEDETKAALKETGKAI